MIRPSRRQSERADASSTLQLHKRLARNRVWTRKLWLASALSCGLSFVLWLFAVPVPWHLGAILLSFLFGLALPTRATLPWALQWINRRGLSYLTALELTDTDKVDTYGFKSAVQERAVKQATRLELPRTQAWWLPFIVVALVLALLPIVPFRSGLRLPTDTAFSRPATPEPAPERGADPVSQSTAEEEEDADETGAEQTPDTANDAASTIEDFDAPAGGSPEANAERVADEEALARFLENMRERPPPEEQPNPFQDLSPRPQSAERNEQQGEGQEGELEATEGQQGEQQEGETGENGEGQQGDQQGEESTEAGSEDGGNEAQGDEQGEQEGEGQPTAGEEGERGDAASGEEGAGDPEQQGLLAEDQEGDGAGGLPGGPGNTETETLESQEDPEQLRGRLQGGPSNLAGTTRLPGSQDADARASGGAAPTFSQGDEQAITEGRIPVEYQEIIRNYFR